MCAVEETPAQEATPANALFSPTVAELGAATDTLDVLLEKSGRLTGSKSGAARPLKDGALVRIHHGSSNHTARAYLLDQKQKKVE